MAISFTKRVSLFNQRNEVVCLQVAGHLFGTLYYQLTLQRRTFIIGCTHNDFKILICIAGNQTCLSKS